MANTKPIHVISSGRIRAVIWANSANGRTWFNVTITRQFQTEDGELRETTSHGRDDLPIVSKLADLAYAWIWSQAPMVLIDEATPIRKGSR